MPINVYTGLQRSGKSYEVVSHVVLAAILAGRDVVTNIDGISEERIHEYLAKKNPEVDRAKFGRVRHVNNEDVFAAKFFPFYDDEKSVHTDTTVQPGDLVCIDEAWRFWGSDAKLLKEHKSFFLEHGHFTHQDTGVACDLVLMVQDIGTLHRFIKPVVAFSFRTHKKVSLGLENTYSLQVWEGSKQTAKALIGSTVHTYDKEIFPLYSSFKGGADGALATVDSRQNIFSSGRLRLAIYLMVFVGGGALWVVLRFFNPPKPPESAKPPSVAEEARANAPAPAPRNAAPLADFSDEWRLAGSATFGRMNYVVIADAAGRLRYESPSMFALSGPQMIGVIDGARVTRYTGSAPGSAPRTQGLLPEMRK